MMAVPLQNDSFQRAIQQGWTLQISTTKGNSILSNEGIETTEATLSKHCRCLPDSISASFAFTPSLGSSQAEVRLS